MTFNTDILGAKRMNLNDFGDPSTFPPAPPAGQSVHVLYGLVQLFLKWSMVPRCCILKT